MHLMALTQPCPRGWRNDRDNTVPGYKDLEFWIDLAQTAERGCFDALFFADIMGPYDSFRDSWEPAVRHAVQSPHDDPAVIISALAAATSHVGFGVTWNTSVHAPYYTAKVFTTLDHLTKGRIAWNIVTGYVKNAESNGLGALLPHDQRYEQADEYMEVVYKLWEHSWDDEAVVADRASGVYADTSRIREINHKGLYYSVRGPHMCEPSRQRTPVLLQAGGSSRGMQFGGKHGEVLFTIHPTPESAAGSVAKVRAAAVEAGRGPGDVRILAGICPIVAETEAEARRKYDEAREANSVEASFALLGGWTGIDFSKYDLDDPVDRLATDGMRGLLDNFKSGRDDQAWKIRDLADWVRTGNMAPDIIGSPQQVADELERWLDVGGVDGFMLQPYTTPGTLKDFVDLVVPELQARGLLRTEYGADSLRGNLFGDGDARLSSAHPAHKASLTEAVLPANIKSA